MPTKNKEKHFIKKYSQGVRKLPQFFRNHPSPATVIFVVGFATCAVCLTTRCGDGVHGAILYGGYAVPSTFFFATISACNFQVTKTTNETFWEQPAARAFKTLNVPRSSFGNG